LPIVNAFLDLLKLINDRLDYEINSFKYKNFEGNIIIVENEEDWNAAQIDFRGQKIASFDIYVE